MSIGVHLRDTWRAHADAMSGRRSLLQRWLDLFVTEVRRPDGSRYLVTIDSTGFGDCYLPIDILVREDDDTTSPV